MLLGLSENTEPHTGLTPSSAPTHTQTLQAHYVRV